MYEGAVYYFDKSIMELDSKKYEKSMNSLTKGYKHIQDTPVNDKTKSKKYIENTVTAIQHKNISDAKINLNKLKLSIEVWQKNKIIKSQDT